MAWGKVVLLEMRGRISGRTVRVAVGFVEQPDGTLLIAAGEPDADWALNLLAEPHCRATIGERSMDVRADPLREPADRAVAVRELILKYGTPAERLGRGPAFRLVPLTTGG